MKLGATRRFRRRPEAIRNGREFVRRWFAPRRDSDDVENLVLAAAEAMNNVVDHATGLDFVVTVSIDGDQAGVVVTDAGFGFTGPQCPAMPPAEATRSRGLALMHALVDDVRIETTPAGTTVALGHRLTTPMMPGNERERESAAVPA